jgi:hypothetical protein
MSEDLNKLYFHDLAWAALFFYYRSIGDRKYCKIISDTEFMKKLRQTPSEIDPAELERKIILDYVDIQNYDLFREHKMARQLLTKIISLQPDVLALQDFTLIDCQLENSKIAERINRIYSTLSSIDGLWMTGVSKIAHLLNDELLVLMNQDILEYFHFLEGSTTPLVWLRIIQDSAIQVTNDFHDKGFSGTPEAFLSENIGYAINGCHKSLVKYLDEYYWLRFTDKVSVPPSWTPDYQVRALQV